MNEQRREWSKRMNPSRLIAAILCALNVPLAASTAFAQQGGPQARVETRPAILQVLAPEFQAPGTVVSLNDSRIAAEVSGPIVWIADVGTDVKMGDVIARIDHRQLDLQEQNNVALIRRLEASLTYESAQVERYEELARNGSTPQSRLEEAIAQREMVAQDLVQARVALEITRDFIARAEISCAISRSGR